MTLVTVRPDGTISNSGVYVAGGAPSAHAALSDTDATTFCNFTTSSWTSGDDRLIVSLGNPTLPSGSVVKSVAIRLRTRNEAPARYLGAYVQTGAIEYVGPVWWTLVNWTTQTTLSGAPAAPAAGTDFNDLRLNLYQMVPDGAVEVIEAWVDIIYVAKPVVASVAPGGTITTTNRPEVTWTATLDSDGGPQDMYSVVIYDDDTEQVMEQVTPAAGPATSWVPSRPLPDGNYRVEVAVRQSFNGVATWSSWSSSTFVIDVARPTAPLLEVQAQPTDGRVAAFASYDTDAPTSTDFIELQWSADEGATWSSIRTERADHLFEAPEVVAGTARNLEIRPYADSGWNDGYSGGWGSVTSAPATIPGSTKTGYRFAGTAASASPEYFQLTKDSVRATVVPGEELWIVCRTYTVPGKVPTEPLRFEPTMRDSSDGSISTLFGESALEAGWQDHAFAVTVPALAVKLQQKFSVWQQAAAAVDVYITDIGIMRGTAAYADGNSPGWAWTGTAGASTSAGPNETSQPVFVYEVPHGVPVQYRARGLHDYGAGSLAAGDWSETIEVTLDAGWWLKHATRPSLNVAIDPHAFPTTSRAARQGVHHPLGRDRPVVVSDRWTTRTGTVTVRVDSDADREALDAILDALAPLLLTGPPGQQWEGAWVAITGNLDRTRFADKAFVHETIEPLGFCVVDAPDGQMIEGFWG